MEKENPDGGGIEDSGRAILYHKVTTAFAEQLWGIPCNPSGQPVSHKQEAKSPQV